MTPAEPPEPSAGPRRLVLATRNPHKLGELREILGGAIADLGLELVGLDGVESTPDVVESEVTFAGNAALKAISAARATGLAALADDSGLAVSVLGGAPGVFSARWAGRHGDDRANLELLLAQLRDVPDQHRQAAFVCAAVLGLPDGRTWVSAGRMPGRLARVPRGSNGFGYDPILVVDGGTLTSAELSPQQKNAISHRGKAFRALLPDLRQVLGTVTPR